jgi:DNA-binding LacI/PurR family transcriptional regulator
LVALARWKEIVVKRTQVLQNPSFKYIDLAQKLMRQIAVTGLQPGDRLPTEDELVEQHSLSRITVRRALSLLEADGLISRKRKAGTFVNRAIQESADLNLVRGTVVIILSPNKETAVDEQHLVENHALTTTLQALEQHLSDHGFSVQIISVGRNELQDRARILRLIERGDLEGICVHGSGLEPYRELISSVPLVTACTFVPTELPWIGENLEDTVYPSIQHLLNAGHERIAMFCGPSIDGEGFAPFAKAYRRAFEERGLPFQRHLLYNAYAHESLNELAEQILATDPRPTAIFASEWRPARAVLTAAHKLNLKIPEDLSLIACGENVQYLHSPVRITTYVPDNAGVGREMGRVLIDIIDGRGSPEEPVYCQGRLLEQESVCPPRKTTISNLFPRPGVSIPPERRA